MFRLFVYRLFVLFVFRFLVKAAELEKLNRKLRKRRSNHQQKVLSSVSVLVLFCCFVLLVCVGVMCWCFVSVCSCLLFILPVCV